MRPAAGTAARPARRPFVVRAGGFQPAYLELHKRGELARRAALALEALGDCQGCPRRCGADRLAGDTGDCQTARLARVVSHFPHSGEEDCLRGWRGSGTIFFSMCSLRCVFCMNHDISQGEPAGETTAAGLARMMLDLQEAGCHNINLVTPSHVVAQILEALPLAVEGGLRVPLVYNSSGFDALETLRLLDGVVDVYMPDFKVWSPAAALRYLIATSYPETARRAIREMHRQVGDLRLDENGLARRGLLVRHLVLPNDVAGTRAIMEFLAREISPHTYVNLMDQYYPAWKAATGCFAEIGRPLSEAEYASALEAARAAGLYRLDARRRHPV